MKTWILTFSLIAFVSVAQTSPTDAPLIVVGDPLVRRTMQLQAGEMVPFDAVCLNGEQAVHQAKRIVACETTLAKAEGQQLVSLPVLIAAVAGALAVGAAVATGVVLATRK